VNDDTSLTHQIEFTAMPHQKWAWVLEAVTPASTVAAAAAAEAAAKLAAAAGAAEV